MKDNRFIKLSCIVICFLLCFFLIRASNFEDQYVKEIKEEKTTIQGTYAKDEEIGSLVVSISIREDTDPFVYINFGKERISEHADQMEIINNCEIRFSSPHFQNYSAKLDDDILILSNGKDEYQLSKKYNTTIQFVGDVTTDKL